LGSNYIMYARDSDFWNRSIRMGQSYSCREETDIQA